MLKAARSWLKAAWRRRRDRRTRARLQQLGAGGGAFVVASTWTFPNPTHTFVLQEMLGLRELAARHGAGLVVLHGEAAGADGLAQRFLPLLADAVPIETLADLHRQDRASLERAHPGRIDAFLLRIAAATGRSLAALRDEPLVLRACTFTRLCELAGVRYLQTWFCYDESFCAMFAAAVLGIPRGLSCHVDHVLADHPFKLVALQLATADLVTAIGARTRDELLAIGGSACAPRILHKRIGVDGAQLRPLRGRTRPSAPFELLSVSRIEPKKGLPVLLAAAAELVRAGLAVRVHVVGGVDPGHPQSRAHQDELQQLVRELGVGDVVTLHGAIANDALSPFFARATAFVAPYVVLASGDKDGIPTSVVEAMAAGLPIVASDVGAIGEVVVDGQEGLLVPAGDPVALAAALRRVLTETDLAARLGAAAARRFDAEFDAQVTEASLHQRIGALLDAGERQP
ncbi:MAG: glycosyltransferase family 4 protein [Planctomycetota bacterium]|jgi:glycosyltransferase involved in cell wall biosynthesis